MTPHTKKIAVLFIAILLQACASTQPFVIREFDSDKWNRIEIAAGKHEFPKYGSIKELNRAINKVKYRSEKKDDWKTPQRFFVEGGDCEDYAIAKFFAIKQNGLHDPQDMAVTIVYDTHLNQHHAVLMVGDDVLDNQISDIRPAQSLKGRYIFMGRVRHGVR